LGGEGDLGLADAEVAKGGEDGGAVATARGGGGRVAGSVEIATATPLVLTGPPNGYE
jgi:hypothetical protein